MLKKHSHLFILLFAAVFILASDALVMKYKVLFGGDEIVSYLCATGNSMDYENVLNHKYPYGKLVDASEYKRYFEITDPYCFKEIATDLTKNDMHPPLYFWLLHVFVLSFGVHIYTGILLNLLLQLLILFFVYKLADHFFNDEHKSSIAALIWAISPANVGVSLNSRPYELLALITVIYLFFFFRWFSKQNKLNILMLVVTGAAGMLTHYTFMYVMASCVLFSVFKFKQISVRNLSVILMASLVSFVIMTMVHPGYYSSFIIQQDRKQEFLLSEFPFRFLKIFVSLIQFIFPVFSFKYFLLKYKSHSILFVITSFIFLSGVLILLFRKKIFSAIIFKKIIPETWLMLIILAIIIFLPYLFFITPVHAIGEQYLVFLYPLMAIVLLQINISFAQKIKITILGVMFLGSIFSLVLCIQKQNLFSRLIEKIETNKIIMTDIIDRRAFPRFIPYLKDGQKILIDETFAYRNDSASNTIFRKNNVLMIYGNFDKIYEERFGVKEEKEYNTGDGIVFIVKQGTGLLYK